MHGNPPAIEGYSEHTLTSKLNITRGIWLMLFATFAFGLMNIFAKLLPRIPVMEIVFFRCFFSFIFCCVALYRERVPLIGHSMPTLIMRGVVGTTSLTMYLYSLKILPLGTAVTLQYISPIFSVLLGLLILKQKVLRVQWVFFFIAFAGVAIIKGFDSRLRTDALVLGLISAFLSAIAYTLISKMRKSEHPMLVVFYFMTIGWITGGIAMLFQFVMPTPIEWFWLVLVGVTTQVAQINMTRALHAENLSTVSIVQYMGIVFALIFGFFFFHESHSYHSLIGTAMILSSIVANVWVAGRNSQIAK